MCFRGLGGRGLGILSFFLDSSLAFLGGCTSEGALDREGERGLNKS